MADKENDSTPSEELQASVDSLKSYMDEAMLRLIDSCGVVDYSDGLMTAAKQDRRPNNGR